MNPHREDLFWQPLIAGFIAGLLGAILGMVINDILGRSLHIADLPEFLAILSFMIVWGFVYLVFLDIYRRNQLPVDRHEEPIYHPSDQDDDPDNDPNRIPIKCRTTNSTHYLINLPCAYSDFQRFAEGILDGKPTSFSEWSGAEAAGKVWNDDGKYKVVIQWICDHRYGFKNTKNELVINDWGIDLFKDMMVAQFPIPSPIETGHLREIRTYSNTPKYGA